ncbi:lysine exporter LysO family protein [Klebsiella pneumoniae]|uniref:Lysine exporter LysO family protein n=1 Tax=Klebsiella pneumoniae TaxID=573 RepID=A0A927DQ81_KLEPN|nr:lysine exporter LysO family protein [Klebsiella pneumoniae]
MFSGLFIILLPLVVGYLLPLRHSSALKLINRMLSWIVYVILFFMGISPAFLDNLASNLLAILHYAAVSVVIILLCNIAALLWLESKMPWRSQHRQGEITLAPRPWPSESLQLCGVVVLGFLLGLTRLPFLQHATEASEYTLIFLLFLVGIQLRNNGMSLRQIVLNRRGMIVAVVVTASSLLGGILNAFILGLPLKTGLAMASGFGWYSLSGILLTESFGPVIGSAAFFNDLCRELLAIMLIPGLIRRSRSTALGLCGATSMDFTLPVLQRSGGVEIVPAAIVHGFLLSLLVPILIAFFYRLSTRWRQPSCRQICAKSISL